MERTETQENTSDDEYGIINLRTGEVEDIKVYDNWKGERWDKVWAQTLAELLELTGESRTKIIAYLIRTKDYKNVIMATVRQISADTGVSTKTVNRTLLQMEKANFIIRLRQGVIMFSPHIMQPGKRFAGVAVIRRWQSAQRGDE